MGAQTDIAGIVEEFGRSFDEFKARYDERFDEVERALVKQNRPGGGNKANGDNPVQKQAFASFVRKGDTEGMLDQKAMSVGSDPDGGYAVPDVIDRDIEKLESESSAIMRLGRIVEAQGPQYKKLVNARGTASGWVGETQERPETDSPKMHEVIIPVNEIYANPKVTQQLLDDAFFDAGGFITGEIGEEFADQMGAAFINGDGDNKPKGLLAHTITTEADGVRAFGALQAVATSANSTLDFDDLKNLKRALKAKYRNGAYWIMNDSTALALSKIKDNDGQYIWRDAVAQGDPDTLLGYPVEIDENMPDVADNAYPVAFGNFNRGYFIPRRLGLRILRDPYTSKPYVNFYATARIGGGVVNSEAIKLLQVAAA